MTEKRFNELTKQLTDEELETRLNHIILSLNQYVLRINRISRKVVFRVEEPIDSKELCRENCLTLLIICIKKKDTYRHYLENLAIR